MVYHMIKKWTIKKQKWNKVAQIASPSVAVVEIIVKRNGSYVKNKGMEAPLIWNVSNKEGLLTGHTHNMFFKNATCITYVFNKGLVKFTNTINN